MAVSDFMDSSIRFADLVFTFLNSRQQDAAEENEEDDDYDIDAEGAYPIAAKEAMERNVRCSLAYMSTRLDRLHRVAWESGKRMPPHIGQNLTPSEVKYFETYCEQLDSYTNEYANFCNLDLTVDL